ncbi:hypothetical protein [Nonomuraea sp. bgisy094]|uniref:hypothetical protein n=1 Tax=Nonomuraea sp. bgisy094 TaxID=3413781 RepID=UPI003EBC05EA
MFVLRQATAKAPLMPLRIFHSRSVSGANLVQFLTLSAMFAFQILVALETGLAMLPAALAIGGVSLFVSARLNTRFRERAALQAGLVLLLGAMGWFARIPVQADYVTDLLPVKLLIVGGGLVLPALTRSVYLAPRPTMRAWPSPSPPCLWPLSP